MFCFVEFWVVVDGFWIVWWFCGMFGKKGWFTAVAVCFFMSFATRTYGFRVVVGDSEAELFFLPKHVFVTKRIQIGSKSSSLRPPGYNNRKDLEFRIKKNKINKLLTKNKKNGNKYFRASLSCLFFVGILDLLLAIMTPRNQHVFDVPPQSSARAVLPMICCNLIIALHAERI